MLQPDYRGENITDKRKEGYAIGNLLTNPFPGLRPFEIEECHLFFGRERHVDEIILKIIQNHFISVLGYSGSGKSSLMKCGVIPTLQGGFMTEMGAEWTFITTRPGTNPIENLAEAILKDCKGFEKDDSEEYKLHFKIVLSLLKSGSGGISRAIHQYSEYHRSNYLILIDQFEELFRYRENNHIENSIEYVNLITSESNDNDASTYVAVTMRSDFVGDCSIFKSFTEKINTSNYLVPRMNRDQKRMAVEGPVAVGGGRISPRLLKRLMTEIGDDQDQLPILQHAMMRTWSYWEANRDEDEPLDLRHYNAVGKMSGALSQHADEIYEELSPKKKQVSEVLFKTLTQKGEDNQGLRRPARLGDIAQLAGVSNEEVMEVVDAFRMPGRSFLMPPHTVQLTQDSIVEISHESLMRIWVRLKNWVDEEHESAQMYIRLSEAAEMYQIGRTGLWRPPDLQLALNWQKKQRPNRLWARRYNEAFERAIVFLDTSRITYEAEQKNQEMLQKRLLKRTRAAAILFGIAFIIAIVFFLYGYVQQQEAVSQAQIAINNMDLAIQNEEKAKLAESEARDAERIAEEQRDLAELRAQELVVANDQLNEAIQQLQVAINNEKQAKEIANDEKENAVNQTIIAHEQRILADSAKVEAQRSFEDAQRLLYLSVAQAMATKSIPLEENDLSGLLAYQAFLFNKKYDGREYDPYIYNGLYSALSQIDGKAYNTVYTHRGSVRSVAFPNNSDTYFTTGADGRVVKHNMDSDIGSQTISTQRFRNKIIEINPSGTHLVSGGDSSFVNVYRLDQLEAPPKVIAVHETYINDIQFLPDNERVITIGGDGTINEVNITSGQVTQLFGDVVEYKAIDISPDGKSLLAGAENGKVILMDIESRNTIIISEKRKYPVFALAFSKDGQQFALGDESGHSELWNIAGIKLKELISHGSRVSDIEFSPDGKLIASASLDGTVNIWVTDELNDLPIVLEDNDSWVWDIDFSPDSKYLLAACEDGEIRVWTTMADIMAQDMCEKLSRNMTMEEWEIYVANEIPFMNTCVDKLLDR